MRRVGGEQLMRPPGELVALARLGPDGEQPDPRGADAQRELRVGHAELAELDEHLRLGVGGGARVDEHRRPGRVGSTTASPGRGTPGSGRSRSRAVATMPPVEPADTTAAASPRRTSWQATATLDRGRRRLASAPSSMASLSSAGTMSTRRPGTPVVASAWRSRAAGPVSRIWMPCSRWAASAPATISSGAWSPPMASTASTGSGHRRCGQGREGPPPGPRPPSRRAGCRSRRARPRLGRRPDGPRAVAPGWSGPVLSGSPKGRPGGEDSSSRHGQEVQGDRRPGGPTYPGLPRCLHPSVPSAKSACLVGPLWPRRGTRRLSPRYLSHAPGAGRRRTGRNRRAPASNRRGCALYGLSPRQNAPN